MQLSYNNPLRENLIKDMMLKQTVSEEQKILDAVLEKLCGLGIIRAGEQIMKRATETGFVCYTMPNYHSPENNCGQGEIGLELNDIY